MSKVGLEHRPVLVVGVHAWPFPQGVLELLDQVAHGVAGAERTLSYVGRHQHDAGAAHGGDLGAHLAQPLGAEGAVGAANKKAEDPFSPFTSHFSLTAPPPASTRH